MSSMKILASASALSPDTSFWRSSRLRKPLRSLCESTRACEESIRNTSASRDISKENTPTTFPPRTAAFSAMLMANAVFPIDGRAAMMIRSEG